ncbi:MAG: radical SAM protein [Deltaproteobacteria bacterium]|nr:radical SAM protein [Deltaproteobacteria bacterium]
MAVGRLRLKPLSYDFPPWRPPSEAGSLLLRVTRGCTWNRCTFCSLYKNVTFQRRPLEEVKSDIDKAASLYRAEVRTVFIGDSNSPSMPVRDFEEILNCLYAVFPHVERVTSYARSKTLQKKPLDELLRLRTAGLTRLHVGLETGSRDLLEKIKKGATPEDMIEGCIKAKEAGFELSVYVLLGLGGEELSSAHARDTAGVLNRIDPHFIRVRTLQPQPGSQLYEDMQAGLFIKASPETVLKEQRALIETLTVSSQYLSDHITNFVPVEGRLPGDKQAMLDALDRFIADFPQDEALQARCARKNELARL